MTKFSDMSGYEQLAYYKSKTPHTADGVPIFIGNIVWIKNGVDESVLIDVLTIDTQEYGEVYIDDGKHECEPKDCYSTREALESAMKGGE